MEIDGTVSMKRQAQRSVNAVFDGACWVWGFVAVKSSDREDYSSEKR